MNRMGQAAFVVIILTLALASPVYAEADIPPDAVRVAGKVLRIDLEQQKLSLVLRSMREVEVQITSETQFHNRSRDLHQLDQILPGMWVVAAGQIQGNVFIAKQVIAGGGDQMQSFSAAGQITNIISAHETFEITTRAGESICISVNERTRFRSRESSIESIEDLKQGMIAGVRGVTSESGVHLATIIVVSERDDLHPADDRAVGRIVDVDERDFTLQIRAGGLVTIVGNEHTKFRSRDGWLQGFEDLQPGMFAIVAGKDLGNDQMKARWIAAWIPENQELSDGISERNQRKEPVTSDWIGVAPGR